MDDTIKNQISRYKAFEAGVAERELSAIIDAYLEYSGRDMDKSAMIDIYVKLHALLSIGQKFPALLLHHSLNFFLSYSSASVSGLAMVHLSKTITLLIKHHIQTFEKTDQDLVVRILSNLILTDIDVVFHNVSETLLILLKKSWSHQVGDEIDGLCKLSQKFHLIFLKHLSSSSETISMPDPFIEGSFMLCLNTISERSSPNSVKVIKWLHNSARKGFDANILFDERHCFKNQSCFELFRDLFDPNQVSLVPDRRASAEVLLSSEKYSLPASNIYELKARIKASLSAKNRGEISNWDLLIVLLSVLLDYSTESTNDIENTIKSLLESDEDIGYILDEFLDCRSRLRGSQLILNHINSQNRFHYEAGLINIALFSGFEGLKLAAYDILQHLDGVQVAIHIGASDVGGEWNTMIRNLGSISVSSEAFSNGLKSANLSDIATIITCLNGILLCTKLDKSLEYSCLTETIFKLLDHFFNLCNSETPESYSTENTEEDYETRNEWKIVGLSSELLVKIAANGTTDLRIKVADLLQEFISKLKHRGAFSSLYDPLLEIYSVLFANSVDLIGEYEQRIWQCVLTETDVDVCTRRSAGLPFLLRAFMHSIPSRQKQNICYKAMRKLIELAYSSRSDVVRIRSINIACEVLIDKAFGDMFAEESAQLFKLSFDLLKSTVWGLRNVGLRLFSAIFKKKFVAKSDNSGQVDIRKISPYADVILEILPNADESQHYSLLLCLSRILIPGQVYESCKSFLDATVSFLQLISNRQYYHWRLVESISRSFNLPLAPSIRVSRASASDTFPKFITDKFVNVPHLRLELNSTHIKDTCLEEYLNNHHSAPKEFLEEILSLVSEDVAVTRRTAAAKSLLNFSRAYKTITVEFIRPLYTLLFDDEESLRYIACQISRELFQSEVINSPLFYINKIWEYAGQQSFSLQREMYLGLFYEAFLSDFNREYTNMTESPIFRVEPQNLYRDFYIETVILTKHLSPEAISVDSCLVDVCRDKKSVELGYLYRTSKCITRLLQKTKP